MDIPTNTELMNQENNIADGYDVFTADVDENHKSNHNYGEIHTEDEWIQARDRYCRPHDNFTNDMPVGIVIFEISLIQTYMVLSLLLPLYSH